MGSKGTLRVFVFRELQGLMLVLVVVGCCRCRHCGEETEIRFYLSLEGVSSGSLRHYLVSYHTVV